MGESLQRFGRKRGFNGGSQCLGGLRNGNLNSSPERLINDVLRLDFDSKEFCRDFSRCRLPLAPRALAHHRCAGADVQHPRIAGPLANPPHEHGDVRPLPASMKSFSHL